MNINKHNINHLRGFSKRKIRCNGGYTAWQTFFIMTEKERLDYVDCALRINNIQLSEQILKITLACVDLVDKSKGKATLDQCLILKSK